MEAALSRGDLLTNVRIEPGRKLLSQRQRYIRGTKRGLVLSSQRALDSNMSSLQKVLTLFQLGVRERERVREKERERERGREIERESEREKKGGGEVVVVVVVVVMVFWEEA